MKRYILLFLTLFIPLGALATEDMGVPLEKATVNLRDKASLQRGAKLYMNYCLGCHSLSYLRYNRLAKDIGITLPDGTVANNLLKDNLIFTGAKVSDVILNAMLKADSKQWFGVLPPDLTLIARVRGPDWLYTYLKSFYTDPKRPFGVNNLVFPDVGMPNVLASLQGVQSPVYEEKTEIINGSPVKTKVIKHLVLETEGSMSSAQFDSAVNDLVNFLAYTASPEKLHRQFIGIWVIIFLIIVAVVAYLLKREFWRDIHPPKGK